MPDNEVIIVDETDEENQELSPEEFEELQRKERLKKFLKPKKKYNTSRWYYASKFINVMGILGIMLGMLLENGTIAAISLGVLFISSIINYVCFK